MLFIFDWDGTISDSTDRIVECMHNAAASVDLPPLASHAVQNIIGLGLPEAIGTLYPHLDREGISGMREAYVEHFVAADNEPSHFFPEVEQTLERLIERGHHIAVATGKSRAGLDRVLMSLSWEDYFHSSRCADETASKPNPKMLHELLDEFDMRVEEAIMIGDTEFDMEMARRAQIPRIAVDYGAHHIDRLKPYEPIMCASNFGQILEFS
jgi:phosphoglycolate phosphatase